MLLLQPVALIRVGSQPGTCFTSLQTIVLVKKGSLQSPANENQTLGFLQQS